MHYLHPPFCLFLFIIQLTPVFLLECINPPTSAIRTFTSLNSYQGNKIPFSILSPNYQGCYVKFDNTNNTDLNRLSKNAFVTFDSDHIVKLILTGQHVSAVDDGAFTSLQCVRFLELNRNNIVDLPRAEIFDGLNSLQTLDLSENQLTVLHDMVFKKLGNLRELNLSRNKINAIHSLAFAQLDSLRILNLEENLLEVIRNDVFNPLKNLTHLNLAKNHFVQMEPQKWMSLTKLKTLNLSGNQLVSFDPNYVFAFDGLKTLNLSSNQLTQLNVFGLRNNLRNLKVIDLNDNPWFCDDLATINHHLADSKIERPGRATVTSPNEEGIACSHTLIRTYTTRSVSESTTKEPSVDRTTHHTDEGTFLGRNSSERVEKDILAAIDERVADSQDKILKAIHYLEGLTIFMIIVFVILISLEIYLKFDFFRIIFGRFNDSGSSESYSEENNRDVEHLRLLH